MRNRHVANKLLRIGDNVKNNADAIPPAYNACGIGENNAENFYYRR